MHHGRLLSLLLQVTRPRGFWAFRPPYLLRQVSRLASADMQRKWEIRPRKTRSPTMRSYGSESETRTGCKQVVDPPQPQPLPQSLGVPPARAKVLNDEATVVTMSSVEGPMQL